MVALPEFDVLICTCRLNNRLRRALSSCYEQTLLPRVVVLVVNSVPIREAEQTFLDDLARTWPNLHVLTTSVVGLMHSLALGLEACQASLIARMDDDDIALPHRFERQVSWMQANPQTAILGTWYQRVDAAGNITNVVHLPTEDLSIRRAMLRGNPICQPSVMFRRQAILELGGYSGGVHAEDYDLWVRATRRPEFKFANLPEICLSYSASASGEARGSRRAYASVLATQLGQLFTGGGLRWAPAAVWTFIKLLFRST
jgi:hypothetical protein